MFGFGKKKKSTDAQKSKKQQDKSKKEAAQQVEKDFERSIDSEIHVMPERFYHAPKKRGNLVTIIIVVVGVLLIGGLGIAAYVFTQRLEAPQTDQSEPVAEMPSQPSTPEIEDEPTPIPSDTVPTTTQNTTPTTTETTTEPDEPEPDPTPVVLPAPDSDRDGLSDQEERLYGTLQDNNDSDGDGFIDGTELVNDYDPTQPQVALADSSLFRVFEGSLFSMWIPADWSEQSVSGDTLLAVQDQNGSRVSVSTIQNSNNRSIDEIAGQLYQQNAYETVRLGALLVARANTGLEYLIPDQSEGIVYRLTYQLSPDNRTHFLTTFAVMVKHFVIE